MAEAEELMQQAHAIMREAEEIRKTADAKEIELLERIAEFELEKRKFADINASQYDQI